jgi:hypothetical protein
MHMHMHMHITAQAVAAWSIWLKAMPTLHINMLLTGSVQDCHP